MVCFQRWSRNPRFHAAPPAAPAGRSGQFIGFWRGKGRVPPFAANGAWAVDDLFVKDETTAAASAKYYPEHALEPGAGSINRLCDCEAVCVVGNADGLSKRLFNISLE